MSIELATWLHGQTGDRELVMAGGRRAQLRRELAAVGGGPFERDLGPARGG
jgi:hypothetical protein